MSYITSLRQDVSHGERVAWVHLGSMILAYVPYFWWVRVAGGAGGGGGAGSGLGVWQAHPDLDRILVLACAAGGHGLAVGIVFGILWAMRRGEDRAPTDERDQAIERRAVRWAYFVLIAGMIIVGCVMPFGSGKWEIVNAGLAAIVVAEVVHYGLAIWGYRRGFHE